MKNPFANKCTSCRLHRSLRCAMAQATLLIILAPVSPGAFAQPMDEEGVHPLLTNRYMVNLGVYFPDKKLSLSADGSVDLPEPGPLEDFASSVRLGESESVGAFSFRWNYKNNWWLDIEYFKTDSAVSGACEIK